MTSNSSTLTKWIIAQRNIQRSPDRTIKKGQILKDILVRAKLPQQLLHVDGSCAGLSPHYYHVSFHVVGLMYVRFRYSGKNLMRFAVFQCISVRFCGFWTPLTPPSKRVGGIVKMYYHGQGWFILLEQNSGCLGLIDGNSRNMTCVSMLSPSF